MAVSAVPKVPRDGVLTIEDGTGSPLTMTVQYSSAFSHDAQLDEAIHVFNRGVRVYTRKGNEGIPGVTFSVVFCSWTDGTDITVLDALTKTGGAAAWVTVATDVEHYCTKMTFTVEGTDHGDDADHTVVFSCVRLVSATPLTEGDPGSGTYTLESLGTITYVGGT